MSSTLARHPPNPRYTRYRTTRATHASTNSTPFLKLIGLTQSLFNLEGTRKEHLQPRISKCY